jgi:gluconate kinase
VIVWVNGAFGVGKSHTAAELVRRVPGAVLSDPEHAGFGLQRMQPKPLRRDFQDIPGWRVAIREILAGVDSDGRWPVVVVPMTIVDEAYFADTVGWLRKHGHDVRHVALVASAETIRRRLRSRASNLVRETWALGQIDRCTTALVSPVFATHVRTDGLGLDAVVEDVARVVGVALGRPALPPWRRGIRRLRVGVSLIRL